MIVLGARSVAAGLGEEIQLAADGSTESVAVPLRSTRATSPSKALERRRERRWIKAAQGGSDQALEHLYRRHWPWAHRAAYLVVHDAAAAEDIAQEAFLAAIRSLDRFDRARPFGPWLNRIVVNRAIDWARARSLRRETATDRGYRRARRRSSRTAPEVELGRLLRRGGGGAADALAGAPGARSSFATSSTTRRARSSKTLGLPRGTVNSRLRRGAGPAGAEMEMARDDDATSGSGSATRRSPTSTGRASAGGGWCSAAYAERQPATQPARIRVRVAVAAGLAALALALVLTPAGAKVVDFVRDVVTPSAKAGDAAHLAASIGRPAGRLPPGALGRPRGRLAAAAGRLPAGELVAARVLRRP